MAVTEAGVRELFARLEAGDGPGFFARVADDVDWTVTGTHPLAGRYTSKQQFQAQFARMNRILPGGPQLRVQFLLISGDWAVVELRSMATAPAGWRFDNRYCWLLRFADDLVVEVRAYQDSAMVQRLIDENPE